MFSFRFLKFIVMALAAVIIWNLAGSVWVWPILWAFMTFALFKWGTRPASETGKTPWTFLGTRGNIFAATLVAVVVPVLAAIAWPALVISWALASVGEQPGAAKQ